MSPDTPEEAPDSPRVPRRSRPEAGIERALPVPRASDVLAEHLRGRILDGELAPGTFLPTERELAVQSGMGRSSVREALKSLEIQGLIAIRPGRSGGSEVIRPSRETLAQSVGMFIQGGQLQPPALIEVRRIIEPSCAELAAQRRSADDLEELGALNAAMKASLNDTPRYLRANVDWHIRVAVASHSELLAGILTAISEAVHAGTDVGRLNEPRLREATIRAHALILDAIRESDSALAHRRMLEHIDAYGTELLGTPVGAS